MAEIGVGKGLGVASAASGFGDWTHFLAGAISDSAFKKIFANLDTIPEWVYREPPNWQATAKKWGLGTGRTLQRSARISEYDEKEQRNRKAAMMNRFRGGTLRQ